MLTHNLPMTPFGNDLDRLFRGFAPPKSRGGIGAVTVREIGDRYIVEVEVPGFAMEELDISILDNQLTLRGKRTVEEDDNAVYHLRSRRRTEIDETLRFPVDVDAESVEAVLARGMLTVTLSKVAETHPHRIEVRCIES